MALRVAEWLAWGDMFRSDGGVVEADNYVFKGVIVVVIVLEVVNG
jgi:hypothetical protein